MQVRPGEKVPVLQDSDRAKGARASGTAAYSTLVAADHIVAMDGNMEGVGGALCT